MNNNRNRQVNKADVNPLKVKESSRIARRGIRLARKLFILYRSAGSRIAPLRYARPTFHSDPRSCRGSSHDPSGRRVENTEAALVEKAMIRRPIEVCRRGCN